MSGPPGGSEHATGTQAGTESPPYVVPLRRLESANSVLAGVADLLRGLFGLPYGDAPPGCDYAAAIEERYSKPRRCC